MSAAEELAGVNEILLAGASDDRRRTVEGRKEGRTGGQPAILFLRRPTEGRNLLEHDRSLVGRRR